VTDITQNSCEIHHKHGRTIRNVRFAHYMDHT